MTTGRADESQAGDDGPFGSEDSHSWELALAGWPTPYAARDIPLWMRAELDRLRAAFPAYSFSIGRGWRGLTFEAWRDPGAGGLYAVITQDAGELWRELQESRDGLRPVTDTCGKEAR